MVLPEIVPNCGAAVSVPPSSRFRPLVGVPRDVVWKTRPETEAKGLTAAQQNGIRYETKVQEYLKSQLGPDYYAHPYLHFTDDSGRRTLIPDGIYLGPITTIFEIKSQHMSEAWYQLRQLYEPVIKKLGVRTSCCEVVRSFDPTMGFPEVVDVFSDPREVLNAPWSSFKVLQWRS